MDANPIPLSQRLSSLHRLGFSDPAVLPRIIQVWGDAPAGFFFQDKADWRSAMGVLRFLRSQEHTATYREMAQRLHFRWAHGPRSMKTAAGTILNKLADGLEFCISESQLDFLHVSLTALAEGLDRMADGKHFQDYVRNEVLPMFDVEDEQTLWLCDVISPVRCLPDDRRDQMLCTLFLEPFVKIQWKGEQQ